MTLEKRAMNSKLACVCMTFMHSVEKGQHLSFKAHQLFSTSILCFGHLFLASKICFTKVYEAKWLVNLKICSMSGYRVTRMVRFVYKRLEFGVFAY